MELMQKKYVTLFQDLAGRLSFEDYIHISNKILETFANHEDIKDILQACTTGQKVDYASIELDLSQEELSHRRKVKANALRKKFRLVKG